MPSFATTIAATALAGLSLAAPTTRQSSPAIFHIQATSIYSTGTQYNNFLAGCHTAAGQEAFCSIAGSAPGNFSLASTSAPNGPAELYYYLNVGTSSGVQQEAQALTFTKNSTYPTLEYGFFGSSGDSKSFVVDSEGLIGVYEGGPGANTFYLCPEYVDYDHEGYPTVSLIGEYSEVPSDSGCDAVTLKRVYA